MDDTNKFYSKNTQVIPQQRFTLKDWYSNNKIKCKNSFDQKQLADRILAESEKQVDVIKEITSLNKREIEHQLEERLKQVEFVKEDIIKKRKEVCIEIDDIMAYNERIIDAMTYIKNEALVISKKCSIFREARIGIDLCHDDVEIELLKEVDMIESVLDMLRRVLEESAEQIRRLRKCNYFFDCDLDDKDGEIKIDKHNLFINENNTKVAVRRDYIPSNPSNITVDEWAEFTKKKIEETADELNSARLIRSYINSLLKQIIDNLTLQYDTVNEAFRHRIEETKEAKSKFEFNHGEISRQVSEITNKIIEIEKAIRENDSFMGLSHSRVNNRYERPGMELVKDLVEAHLINEAHQLRENFSVLRHNLLE
ncbi:hypothetical protein FQR65_LT11765, partial [Abscondita terminalis]